MARPRRVIDLNQVRELAGIGCTYEEIARVLGYSKVGILKRKKADAEFREAIEDGIAKCHETLRRTQWNLAMKGNPTMNIWLGKQLLGQKDTPLFAAPFGGSSKKSFVMNVSYAESPGEESGDDDKDGE